MEYRFADCTIDGARRTLTRAGQPVAVEPQVFDLLFLLARNADRVVTRDELIDVVWGGRIVSESAISARIAAARRAVNDDGKRQAVIRTVARRGLQMATSVEAQALSEPPPPPSGRFATPRIRFVQTPRGDTLGYTDVGEGAPVIRVHSLLADIGEEWRIEGSRAALQAVSSVRRLLCYDPVGCGQSAPGSPRFTPEAMADDIIALADALGLERFALMAESGGSKPALHCAARHPDRVTRLAITGGYMEGRQIRKAEPAADPLRAMMAEGWSDIDGGFARAFLVSYMPEGPIETLNELARMIQTAAPADYALGVRDASNQHSSESILPDVRCPVLLFHARRDGVHPLDQARKLAAGIPDAELVVLETANHAPLPGNAVYADYISQLQGFLAADVTAPPPAPR